MVTVIRYGMGTDVKVMLGVIEAVGVLLCVMVMVFVGETDGEFVCVFVGATVLVCVTVKVAV